LSDTLQSLGEAELRALGCEPKDLGLHSFRKGPASYCTGQVSGPNVIAVQLRMGHSLGKVNDVYFFTGDGSDQLCGCFASGLPFTTVAFGTLPPHFLSEVAAGLDTDYWRAILDGYDNYPSGVKDALPFLLASLVYHENFLHDQLADEHPIWNSRVFSANPKLDTLRSSVLTGIQACPNTGLTATGVPPHLAIAANLRDLTESVEALKRKYDRGETILPYSKMRPEAQGPH
jgi:hypothetical protein